MIEQPNIAIAKKKALELLEQAGVTEPPVDPAALAEILNIEVKFGKFEDPEYSEKVAGFYDPTDNAIYVNQEMHPYEQTYTIAHEIGHFLLHPEWTESETYEMLLRRNADWTMASRFMLEADAFARNLLVPRFLLKQYLFTEPEKLPVIFVVSPKIISERLMSERINRIKSRPRYGRKTSIYRSEKSDIRKVSTHNDLSIKTPKIN